MQEGAVAASAGGPRARSWHRSCACDGVAEGLIGLVDQLCPGFRFSVQGR